MTQFESDVKVIPYSQERVYAKLSDLNRSESIKDKIPGELNGFSFDADTVSFNVPPAGDLTLKIVEREPFGCIKFETVQSPLPFHFWIQIAPVSEEQCKIKLTFRAEINTFMKSIVQKPLKEGIEKAAETIAAMQY
jgi:hypothetical protein